MPEDNRVEDDDLETGEGSAGTPESLDPQTFGAYDCVVILTDHSSFPWDAMVANSRLIVDARDAIKGRHPHVYRLGAPVPVRATAEAMAAV